MAALALQGPAAKRFMRHLNPLHTPPQNVPFMRMVRLLDLAFHREYQRLIDDNVLWLGSRFASTNSDFYQCPERREAYGCIVSNMNATKYIFKDGRRLFVSNQTLNEGARAQLAIPSGTIGGCEVVISFKEFDGAKTGVGVGSWLHDEHLEKGTYGGLFSQFKKKFVVLFISNHWFVIYLSLRSQANLHHVPFDGRCLQCSCFCQPLPAVDGDEF